MTNNIQTADLATVKKDRMLNVLYFVCIYKSDVSTYYYTYMIGLSVMYNLVFMLAAFLSSIGVKNYKMKFSIVLIVIDA